MLLVMCLLSYAICIRCKKKIYKSKIQILRMFQINEIFFNVYH